MSWTVCHPRVIDALLVQVQFSDPTLKIIVTADSLFYAFTVPDHIFIRDYRVLGGLPLWTG